MSTGDGSAAIQGIEGQGINLFRIETQDLRWILIAGSEGSRTGMVVDWVMVLGGRFGQDLIHDCHADSLGLPGALKKSLERILVHGAISKGNNHDIDSFQLDNVRRC